MRVVNVLLAIIVIGLGIWFAHTRDVKARQQATHEAAVTPFQRDLPIGTSRADVEKYLQSRGLKYSATWESGKRSWSDVVELEKQVDATGRCVSKSTLVSLEFNSSGQSANDLPQPTDKLQHIYADNPGPC